MSDWLDAFDGIDYAPQAGTALSLKEVVSPRLRNRIDTDCVRIPIRTLYDIAQRINDQSERIARLEGAGATLDSAALEQYEAQQAEAERASRQSGVLVEDAEADWAALYNHHASAVTQGHISDVRRTIVSEGWQVARVTAEGLLSGDADLEDQFPETLVGFQAAYGRFLRAEAESVITAAEALDANEPARTPEDPITGAPGDE